MLFSIYLPKDICYEMKLSIQMHLKCNVYEISKLNKLVDHVMLYSYNFVLFNFYICALANV